MFSFEEVKKICQPHPLWGGLEHFMFELRHIVVTEAILKLRPLWNNASCCFSDVPNLINQTGFPTNEGKKHINEMVSQPISLLMFGTLYSICPFISSVQKIDKNKDKDIVVIDGNHRMSVLAIRQQNGILDKDLKISIFVGIENLFKDIKTQNA
jgi:hypothetical protein